MPDPIPARGPSAPMTAERYEPPNPHGRYRYGSWRGGPDPLAPPYDVRAAVDKIGQDLLSAGNLRDSLRELLQRGLDGRGGLDRLAERIAAAPGRRPGGAATSAAPSTRSGPRWTRHWPPSGRPWPASTGTMPASPRWSWTRCPTTWPALYARSSRTSGARPRRGRRTRRSSRCCSARCWTPSSPG